MALGFAPAHIGSFANCQGCLAISPRPEDESLIRMGKTDGRLNHRWDTTVVVLQTIPVPLI